jgi:hypothetical protein
MDDKNIPSKRMKTWWRHSDRSMPLKAFARFMAKGDDSEASVAKRWLSNKRS